jgi:hypothetical protein
MPRGYPALNEVQKKEIIRIDCWKRNLENTIDENRCEYTPAEAE